MTGITLEEFKARMRWAGLRKSGNGRKYPINPKTGNAAKINDDGTMGSYAEVVKAAKIFRFSGLNVAVTPQSGIVAIDIDSARKGDGSIWPVALSIVEKFDSYTEWSISGKGLHIFVQGRLDGGRDSLVTDAGNVTKSCTREEAAKLGLRHVEIYGRNHWMGFTGNRLDGSPATINPNQEAIDWLASWLMGVEVVGGIPKREEYHTPLSIYVPGEEELRDALRHIPLGLSNEDWWRIVASVYSAYPNNTGTNILLDWCGNSFRPHENPRKVLEGHLRSLMRSQGKITVLTALWTAESHGWDRKSWRNGKMQPRSLPSAGKLAPSPLSGAMLDEQQLATEARTVKRLLRDAYMRGFVDGLSQAQRERLGAMLPPRVAPLREMFGIGLDAESGAVTVPLVMPFGKDGVNVEFRHAGGRRTYQQYVGSFLPCDSTEGTGGVIVLPDTLLAIETWMAYGHIVPHGWGERPTIIGLGPVVDDPLADFLSTRNVVAVEFGGNTFDPLEIEKMPANVRRLSLPFSSPEEALSSNLADGLFGRAVSMARKIGG